MRGFADVDEGNESVVTPLSGTRGVQDGADNAFWHQPPHNLSLDRDRLAGLGSECQGRPCQTSITGAEEAGFLPVEYCSAVGGHPTILIVEEIGYLSVSHDEAVLLATKIF